MSPRTLRPHRAVIRLDDVAITCWCEAEVLHLPRSYVLEGRTDTCGRPDCHEAA
jgi:hypothetical protein